MPDVNLPLPFEAYTGKKPYIFVSYAHIDGGAVFDDITELHKRGYRVWYDEGIDPGNEWPDEIAKALDAATWFLVFVSEAAVKSRNVRNEINFALNKQKPFLAIYLDKVHLPPGLELRMGDIQAIMKWRMSHEHYWRKVLKTLPQQLVELQTAAADSLQGVLTTENYIIEWSALPRAAQLSPIRTILALGREIICVSRNSPEIWVYAFHRDTGQLLWQVRRIDSRKVLQRIGWTIDYLYLTGDIEVEPDLRFVNKVWLREGDGVAGLSWYDTGDYSKQKYDVIPEWDQIKWQDVKHLEENALKAISNDLIISVVDGVLNVQKPDTEIVSMWEPPQGVAITAVGISEKVKPVVALSNGYVCLLKEDGG